MKYLSKFTFLIGLLLTTLTGLNAAPAKITLTNGLSQVGDIASANDSKNTCGT